MSSKILTSLLVQTWSSPVFGNSFAPDVSINKNTVLKQINAIVEIFYKEMVQALSVGMPGASAGEVAKVIGQIAPKTVSFCPALAAGEVHDTARLGAVSVAIGLMYWGDQTMDRGDEAMPYAIRLFAGQPVQIPEPLAAKAHAQAKALQGIKSQIEFLARPEDVPFVLACFREQVLLNEVTVQELSQKYLQTRNKNAFLTRHGKELARLITVDAGFPSVASSLYALYRWQNPALPTLAEIYADQTMLKLLQVCNVIVRILDELGDWDMDAGNHPEWGVFTINPFNQPNKTFVGELLGLGMLHEPQLTYAIEQFHKDRQVHSARIIEILLTHVKNYIHRLPENKFGLYVALCKRVLEIGYVNRAGDMALTLE